MKHSQKVRLLVLLAYAAFLFWVCHYLFGAWLPPSTEKGLWLYASLANILLGSLLLSPYFTKPAGSVSDAVVAALALPGVYGSVLALHRPWALLGWEALLIYFAVVIATGSGAILFLASRTGIAKQIGRSLYDLSIRLGETSLIFSLLYLFAIFAFHIQDRRELVVLSAVWAIIVPIHFLENGLQILSDLIEVWSPRIVHSGLGELHIRKDPSLLLLRRDDDIGCEFGDVLSITSKRGGRISHVMVLDELRLANESWVRCYEIEGKVSPEIETRLRKSLRTSPSIRLAGFADQTVIDSAFKQSRAYSERGAFVGIVAPNTDTAMLKFEITRTDMALAEGQLVEVQLAGKTVLYQIIGGLTQEEVLAEKSTYGYARASAKKVGSWDSVRGRFEHVPWIPQLNEPVFLTQTVAKPEDSGAIGFFPGTSYPVRMDIQSLVTHNAAILGILGVGKTFLALELIERMLLSGIKVIVLDLTNQYATELSRYFDAQVEQGLIGTLKAAGPPGKNKIKQIVAEGGSVEDFRGVLKTQLGAFAATPGVGLKIYNPAMFEVWKQDSKIFSGQASMAQLTPTEITRIVAEVALEVCSTTVTDQARMCIVLEEAHSLIPEWNAVASDGDKAATNGTAKAILQGRKYGFGCLVITQRTANVTKTILNQCNTVFALRVFDTTGMEFLSNYIGKDYAGVLSTLEDRHAVVFGKASSCSDPVLVRLNDRDTFLRLNRP
jgi:hypothetical protein